MAGKDDLNKMTVAELRTELHKMKKDELVAALSRSKPDGTNEITTQLAKVLEEIGKVREAQETANTKFEAQQLNVTNLHT